MLNDVISETHYDHFFHHDLAGGRSEVLLGKGLVDMCWYLPSGEPNDTFSDAITFLNLHGDARDYPQQSRFLSKISTMCFIVLTEENLKFDEETIKILNEYSSSFGGIIILNDTEKSPESLKSVLSTVNTIKLTGRNSNEIKHLVQKRIINLQANSKDLKTLNEHCIQCSTALQVIIDEHCGSLNEGLGLASGIKKLVICNEAKESSTKEEFLPLQGDPWQTWASKDKELYRQVYRGNKLVNIYTDEIKEEKQMLRQHQLKYVESLTPLMDIFIKILLKFGGPSNRLTRNYFLQCLKLVLRDYSRDQISLLHQQYRSQEETATAIKEQIRSIDANKMICFQASNYFGLEHLFRELGQIYEAASESSPIPGLSHLPEAFAELLIDGYPLELMDGNAAHVPLHWVTAVITEMTTKLGDPKVFILSVLGLQSTGKSTLLNTVFGLNFKVSPGRCTRGAFMQLLPLDEQLRKQTSFSYILIVDTEGLHTSEPNPQKAHKHDNELATFVIGLADVTLINIYGEIAGTIDEILQTSVHAFLRMSQVVKYRRSCQFIHQNATSTEFGRENFTQKLNEFTVDAAKEANVEGQYRTFNDVIKFNDMKDIHHFPGLWTGSGPMAHVSRGYSIASQKLKHHLIEILKEPRKEDMLLSSFQHKVSDLWVALLKENFIFSFKNTLEITAYNSLETQYSQWEWEFRKAMLNWEQVRENEISTAEPNTVSELVDEKCKELDRHIYKLYEDHKSEMDRFFSKSKHSVTLVEWKARFERKLVDLRHELRDHAASQCKKLGNNRNANSMFEKERIKFTELMTDKVQELVESLKEEQKNLKGKKLTELNLNLFSPEYLKQYCEEGIITRDQEKNLCTILQEVPISEECITVGEVLSIQQVISILNQRRQSEQVLEARFNHEWDLILRKRSYFSEDPVNVEVLIERVLFDHVRSYDRHILQEKPFFLRERGADLKLLVEQDHYAVQFEKRATYTCVYDSTDSYKVEAQKMTNEVLDRARSCIDSITSLESDFKPDYTRDLLKTLDCEIDKHSSRLTTMKFTPKYKFDVYLSACGYAVVEFEKMAMSFRKKNNPWLFFEEETKGPLFTRFKNQYYQKKAEEGIANSLCSHFEGHIKTQVRKSLSSTIVEQMKISEHHFKSKMAFKVKVLTDLYYENAFDSYMVYVTMECQEMSRRKITKLYHSIL